MNFELYPYSQTSIDVLKDIIRDVEKAQNELSASILTILTGCFLQCHEEMNNNFSEGIRGEEAMKIVCKVLRKTAGTIENE